MSADIDEINLLTGSYSPDHNVKGRNLIKLAAMICCLGFIGNFGMTVYEAKLLESEKSSIDSELRQIFATYFPNEPYLDRPKSQLTGLLDRAAADSDESAFELYLLTISSVVPNHAATVEEMSYKDGDFVLLCTVQDLSSLDTIVRAFNDLGTVSAELLSSGARDGKVTGRFRLKVRASG